MDGNHLALVEFDLAKGEGSHQNVDASCYETVVADLVVEAVDALERVFTEKDKEQRCYQNIMEEPGSLNKTGDIEQVNEKGICKLTNNLLNPFNKIH